MQNHMDGDYIYTVSMPVMKVKLHNILRAFFIEHGKRK